MISTYNNMIISKHTNEILLIEAWGKDSIRIRSSRNAEIEELPGALSEPGTTDAKAYINDDKAVLENGRLKAILHNNGRIQFMNTLTGEILLEEQGPMLDGPICRFPGRFYKHIIADRYQLRLEFLSNKDEKIYGLGQHAHGYFDNKGTMIDLYHHNTEFIIPFAVSSQKYGFLWNNPGLGKAEIALNRTVWTADCGKQIDYWVTTGDTYAQIMERYAEATGKPPMMPDWAAGYWQCKLRYKTQEELLEVAREHKKRGLPMDVIIIDFFHWPDMGDWKFDPEYWPDPSAMVNELEKMGIKLMVSVWPTVDTHSENYRYMEEQGLLVKTESGVNNVQRFIMRGVADEHRFDSKKSGASRSYVGFYDSTNPEARKFLWSKLKENYYKYGIKLFWLDCTEPEIKHLDYHNLHYHLGNGQEATSLYPNLSAQTIYDGLKSEGDNEIVILSRSGWAGVQKYGAVLWSGDIEASFEELRKQVTAGLNVAMSGVPWWNTDIGGFRNVDRNSPSFCELLIRWFQFGAFCPVFRMHGPRSPNEVWTYGEEPYEIMKKYLLMRERLKPYILEHMRLAHEKGIPPMRPLFFDYDKDEQCYEISDEYLFGTDLIVAPVMYEGARSRMVYLPRGEAWKCMNSGMVYEGGQFIRAEAPLDVIPLYTKLSSKLVLF